MEETKRKKPKFLRVGWHKMIKLGSKTKKKRKWKRAIGRHNKLRLGKANHTKRPKVGWGADSKIKGLVKGLEPVRIENLNDLKKIQKNQGAIIAKVGKRKKEEILTEAKKMKITILNKYKKENLQSKEKKK